MGNDSHVGFIVNHPTPVTLMRRRSDGLWEQLEHRSERRANGI